MLVKLDADGWVTEPRLRNGDIWRVTYDGNTLSLSIRGPGPVGHEVEICGVWDCELWSFRRQNLISEVIVASVRSLPDIAQNQLTREAAEAVKRARSAEPETHVVFVGSSTGCELIAFLEADHRISVTTYPVRVSHTPDDK